uniref:Uncharacterized protein n=1 Tax=Anguilla anguilla TaxID=7936 RepID=A0A0E9PSF1_ANGAN
MIYVVRLRSDYFYWFASLKAWHLLCSLSKPVRMHLHIRTAANY